MKDLKEDFKDSKGGPYRRSWPLAGYSKVGQWTGADVDWARKMMGDVLAPTGGRCAGPGNRLGEFVL